MLVPERMSALKLGPPHPPVPPIPNTTSVMLVNWSGDAMDTLKLKIGLLKRENSDSTGKMAAAEKVIIIIIIIVIRIIIFIILIIIIIIIIIIINIITN